MCWYSKHRIPDLEHLRASVDYDQIPLDADPFQSHRASARGCPDRAVIEQEIYPAVSADPNAPDFVGHALLRSGMVCRGHRADGTPDSHGGHRRGYPGGLCTPTAPVPAETPTDYDLIGSVHEGTGLYALEQVPRVDLLCRYRRRRMTISALWPGSPRSATAARARRYCWRRPGPLAAGADAWSGLAADEPERGDKPHCRDGSLLFAGAGRGRIPSGVWRSGREKDLRMVSVAPTWTWTRP